MKHTVDISDRFAGRRSVRRTGWLTFAGRALAVGVLVAGGGIDAFAQAKPDGSIAGLTAKFVDVKGVRTRYYEAGQGEPMVLVHGEGWSGHSSANTWSKNIPGLAKRFHVFAADKLASGMTGNPLDDKDYNIQGEVEHMYQFIQTMKLGKVHLVGQSRGGGLVFFLSVAHPEIVRTLVIVDTNTASPDTGPDRSTARAVHVPERTRQRGVEVPASRHFVQAGRGVRRRVLGGGILHGESAEIERDRREVEGACW